eukprot:TRINITY_DN4658_c0_g1_i1.p1 TRINITY_DN4658_c0_g1~~TRINITY_DN4658_c0_g1_i1.p1  ORF type:complete len:205 (-),score=30.50 TRINITY_DN4658_c0_g1_i1:167-781(-)
MDSYVKGSIIHLLGSLSSLLFPTLFSFHLSDPQSTVKSLFLSNTLLFLTNLVSIYFIYSDNLKKRYWNGTLGFLFGIVLFYFIGIIYGAPLFSEWDRTFQWALLMSNSVLFRTSFALGFDPLLWMDFYSQTFNKLGSNKDVSISFPAIGSVVGCWFGAIPIPLDWDRPWQKWPVSCAFGCWLGLCLGTIATLLFNLLRSNSKRS